MTNATPDKITQLIQESINFADGIIPKSPEELLAAKIEEARELAREMQAPFEESRIQDRLKEEQQQREKLENPDFGLC